MAGLLGLSKLQRRRVVSGDLPMALAGYYSQGQAAVMAVIYRVVRRSGHCGLTIERMAKLAGVGCSTVQNTLRAATANGHAHVERQHPRGKVRITMDLNWIDELEHLAWSDFEEMAAEASPRARGGSNL
jgi:hypothetical protein